MPEEYDFNKLQADAVRRAREMQSRAKIPQMSPQSRRSEPNTPPPAPVITPEKPPENEAVKHVNQPAATGGLMQAMFQDRERTIILALLLLLSGEDGNHELMFALMFLLM